MSLHLKFYEALKSLIAVEVLSREKLTELLESTCLAQRALIEKISEVFGDGDEYVCISALCCGEDTGYIYMCIPTSSLRQEVVDRIRHIAEKEPNQSKHR